MGLLEHRTLPGEASSEDWGKIMEQAERDLLARHGNAEMDRIRRGLRQMLLYWRPEDGGPEEFYRFALEQFVPRGDALEALFRRLEHVLEQAEGHLNEVAREARRWADLDLGPLQPIDRLLATYDPSSHLVNDFFRTRIAFAVLLNFRLSTVEERLQEGFQWSRRDWAEARLTQRFARRIPPEVLQGLIEVSAHGELYVSEYNIWAHHVLDQDGTRLFRSGQKLIAHWNLRDEIRAAYADPAGLPRQRLLARVLERIVTQTIPRVVINNPRVDWIPETNEVRPAPESTIEVASSRPAAEEITPEPEADTRYHHWWRTFQACRAVDRFVPHAPSLLARRAEDRELPEHRVEELLLAVLKAPVAARVAQLISKRLGRKLEPFDIWYPGFRPTARYPEPMLDGEVRKRFPTVASFQQAIPDLLVGLEFSRERARWLAERIVVEPSRGAGHALPALRRGDQPRLHTRFGPQGMDYKSFNIALHELGHNVEQVLSLYEVDSPLLAGVPNNAFTEAIAMLFQKRDLELLGLAPERNPETDALETLQTFWNTYEIAGCALVDLRTWRWLYAHPDATPHQLREAVLRIAQQVWNEFYAPVFGQRGSVLLAVYSHMVYLMLYLPDYPIGHLVEFQIEDYLRRSKKKLGPEIERITRLGRLSPDLWMLQATGSRLPAEPLLKAAEEAVRQLE